MPKRTRSLLLVLDRDRRQHRQLELIRILPSKWKHSVVCRVSVVLDECILNISQIFGERDVSIKW